MKFKAQPVTKSWPMSALLPSQQMGEVTATLLPDATIARPPTSGTSEDALLRSWPESCNGLSRVAQSGGNVKVLTKEKSQVLAERNGWTTERAKGYVDGETYRLRAKKPSKYALVGIDEYSLGFRAGYYERQNGVATMKDTADVSHISDCR